MADKKPLTLSEFASLGGKARAKKLTPEQRRASAQKAIEARWAKQHQKIEKTLREIDKGLTRLEQKAKERTKRKKKSSPKNAA